VGHVTVVTALSQHQRDRQEWDGTGWEHQRRSAASGAYGDIAIHPVLRTVNPSANAYSGSNPLPATAAPARLHLPDTAPARPAPATLVRGGMALTRHVRIRRSCHSSRLDRRRTLFRAAWFFSSLSAWHYRSSLEIVICSGPPHRPAPPKKLNAMLRTNVTNCNAASSVTANAVGAVVLRQGPGCMQQRSRNRRWRSRFREGMIVTTYGRVGAAMVSPTVASPDRRH
jgi:hypothetical protein